MPPEETVTLDRVAMLPGRLDASGHLDWDVPAGQWTILRFGHTTTGKDNHPAPEPGPRIGE